ncbi:MAG TPA: alpha-galactosidase, partial [Bryobacteraceae bacterium]|nr:alpha-galactosidase [Bryobacteraceae bacterium]
AHAAEPHLLVRGASRAIERQRIRGRAFLIGGRTFEDGIHMPSPGEILVRLPVPAALFEASVGVDGNDLGYYANAGRGSVTASVEAAGSALFRSGVLHEGMPAVPVRVELAGAREFSLKLAAVGAHPSTWQKEWDQADWADARVTLQDGRVLRLSEVPQGPLAGAFDTEPPFSFRYDGTSSSELLKSWKLERKQAGGGRIELTWSDPKTGLAVRLAARVYEDSPTVEWTLYLRNSGQAPTPVIEDIQPLDAAFERDATSEFLLRHWRGSPNAAYDFEPLQTPLGPQASKRLSATGGRPTDADLCYFNVDTGASGFLLALGWPGQWAATFERDRDRGLRIRAGQELTHFRLLPGEEVRTPLIALQFWEGDWVAAQNVWRRWMLTYNLPRPGGRPASPQLAGGSNRYTIEMQDASEENQFAYLKRELDAGVPLDYWWMDAGWYPLLEGWWNTGTWEPDPKRFPRGLAPVAAAAHAHGVKTVVWFEPERVNGATWLARTHPEWLLGPDRNKNYLLDLGNPAAWRWLTDHISGLIGAQGIDLYRQDFNFQPLALWRAHDAPDRQGITEIRHVTGLLAYWDELRRRFPELRMDTCASGGRRLDLETLRRAVPLWRSDHAYEPTSMQTMTYGLSFWIPYFGTAVNSLDPYLFRSQMTPAMGIGFEPGRTEGGYEQFKRLVAEWRGVAGFYNGDFYPLTSWSLSNDAWMAWQFDRPAQGDGIVQAFRRPESPFESARFPLRGLDPGGLYAITQTDTPGTREASGRELMERGLETAVPARPGAVVLLYKRLP